MKMMAPVLHRAREPQVVEELELDDPKQGEVMIRMVASGVCHSCLHAADGSWTFMQATMPMVLGDEGAGVIEKVGPGVEHVKPGDPVIIAWTPTCGRCHYCVIGRSNLCDTRPPPGRMADGTVRMHLDGREIYHYGGISSYASYAVIGATSAIKIRDDMPLDRAALIGCSVMTGVGSVLNTAQVPAGASLAVFGCGGIGLNAVQGGRLASAEPLIAVDVADNKLEMARAMGATHLINGSRQNVPERVREITGRGADYATVTVGAVAAVQQAWDSLAKGGTCVIVGIPPTGDMIQIEPRPLVAQEKRLIGSCYGSARPLVDFPRMIDLYMSGKLKIDELITRRYSIDEANEAFKDLAAGQLARGLIVF